MDKEYMMLEIISIKSHISQRELSSKLGISLGSVNILLRKMAYDGIIIIEKTSSNRISYFLTSKGVREKELKTYEYIKFYYNLIDKLKENIINLLDKLNRIDQEVVLISDNEEAKKVIIQVFSELDMSIEIIEYNDIFSIDSNSIIIVDRYQVDSNIQCFNNLVYLDQIIL